MINKYTNYTKLSATTIALLFALTPLAHASLVVGTSNEVDVSDDGVRTMMKADEGMTVSPMKNIQMEDGEVSASQTRRGDGNEGSETDGGEGKDGHATGTLRAEEVASAQGQEGLEKAEFHIGLRDSEKDATGTEDIDDAAKVRTAHDFENFASFTAKHDEHLKKVDMKEGKIDVDYEEPAKLFGFIGTTVNAHARVDAGGNVDVSYPWYHIFMKKHVSSASLQSSIARAIAGEKKGEKEGIASTTMEATIQTSMGMPDLFALLIKTLKAESGD